MFRKIFKKIVKTPNPHVIPPHMVWKEEAFFLSAKKKYSHITGIPDIRCYFLQSCLRSLGDVPGDVAEFGVRRGKSSLFMHEAVDGHRVFWLFDSFEGLSDPEPSVDRIKTAYGKDGVRKFAVEFDEVRAPLEAVGMNIMKGWIPDRFEEVADKRFCLLHVDVDLHDPTLAALEYFWPRLNPHGMMVCDDYGTSRYPGARRAVDAFFADKPEKPVELPQGQCFVVKR